MKKANLGKALEEAVKAAAAVYHRQGRGEIRKRHARQLWTRGEVRWISKGDVDFSGDADGRSFYAECKETHHDALPLSELEKRPHQILKLRETAARGCTSGLIVGFMPEWSCWWLPFADASRQPSEIAKFLTAPFRRSINRNMCAAWGLELKVVAAPRGGPMVLFLDGRLFPGREESVAAVEADRMANPLELSLDLGDDGWKPSQKRIDRLFGGGSGPVHPALDLLEIAKAAKRKKGRR